MWVKRIVWCVAFLSFSVIGLAQPPQYAFRITFADKKGTVNLKNPVAFLSARAIARRSTASIKIDSTDLPVSPLYLDTVLTTTDGILHTTSRWLNDCVILVTDTSKISGLAGKSYITSITQVAYYPTGLKRPAKAGKFDLEHKSLSAIGSKTTGSSLYYGNTYNQTTMVNGDYLHDAGFKGQGKLIAVLDAGYIAVDTHPGFDSLRQSGRLVDVHNFTLDTSYVYSYDDHGTGVLSTMAGYMPGTYVGTAPLASYALYITEDDLSEQPIEMDNMVAGAERADSIGADIISTSLGYDLFDNPAYNLTYAEIDGKTTVAAKAVNIATQKGILFVPTAGNEGIGDGGWFWILTPGDADSGLTVGAVTINKIIAGFSGYGPNSAGQIKPDVCDLGVSADIFTATGGFGEEDGTSFATPQIAGWAACLWQAKPDATPYQLRTAIIKSANHYTDPGTQIGYGVPDFKQALQSLDVKDTPRNPADSSNWVTIGPNPFNDVINLNVYLATPQTVNFVLVDAAGRTIFKTSRYIDSWSNPFVSLPSGYIAAGVYMLKIATPDKKRVVKLVKN